MSAAQSKFKVQIHIEAIPQNPNPNFKLLIQIPQKHNLEPGPELANIYQYLMQKTNSIQLLKTQL